MGSSGAAACSRRPARASASTCSGPGCRYSFASRSGMGLVAGRSELARLAVRRSRAEAGRVRRQRCLSSKGAVLPGRSMTLPLPREQERHRLLVSVDRANRGIAVHVQVVEDHQHGLDARRSLFAWKSGRRRRGEVIGEIRPGWYCRPRSASCLLSRRSSRDTESSSGRRNNSRCRGRHACNARELWRLATFGGSADSAASSPSSFGSSGCIQPVQLELGQPVPLCGTASGVGRGLPGLCTVVRAKCADH